MFMKRFYSMIPRILKIDFLIFWFMKLFPENNIGLTMHTSRALSSVLFIAQCKIYNRMRKSIIKTKQIIIIHQNKNHVRSWSDALFSIIASKEKCSNLNLFKRYAARLWRLAGEAKDGLGSHFH